jgi:hypothetical protein
MLTTAAPTGANASGIGCHNIDCCRRAHLASGTGSAAPRTSSGAGFLYSLQQPTIHQQPTMHQQHAIHQSKAYHHEGTRNRCTPPLVEAVFCNVAPSGFMELCNPATFESVLTEKQQLPTQYQSSARVPAKVHGLHQTSNGLESHLGATEGQPKRTGYTRQSML